MDCIESKAVAIGNHVFAIPKAHRHLITEYFLLFQRKKEQTSSIKINAGLNRGFASVVIDASKKDKQKQENKTLRYAIANT